MIVSHDFGLTLEIPEGSPLVVDKTRKIHEQITKETWHQGSLLHYESGDVKICGLCLLGWLLARYANAEDKNVDYRNKCTLVDTALHSGSTIVDWQDDKDRTFEEVQGLLRELDL